MSTTELVTVTFTPRSGPRPQSSPPYAASPQGSLARHGGVLESNNPFVSRTLYRRGVIGEGEPQACSTRSPRAERFARRRAAPCHRGTGPYAGRGAPAM